ncbi:hypothetical protein PR048_008153 [Dryococelus australis]|uniref:Uncharacterized protein n=1 Tax=Dryococelus australis TaxID=614101 RepID=A0ABQ9HWA7_9NEOP|nr:hypothetical protein PR048_008153 [Dryococelus australis]
MRQINKRETVRQKSLEREGGQKAPTEHAIHHEPLLCGLRQIQKTTSSLLICLPIVHPNNACYSVAEFWSSFRLMNALKVEHFAGDSRRGTLIVGNREKESGRAGNVERVRRTCHRKRCGQDFNTYSACRQRWQCYIESRLTPAKPRAAVSEPRSWRLARGARLSIDIGATVAERLARSPSSKTNRIHSLAGSPDFRKWESCRTMLLVDGFSRGFPLPLFRRRSIFTSITLIGSQDLALQPRLATPSYPLPADLTGRPTHAFTRPHSGMFPSPGHNSSFCPASNKPPLHFTHVSRAHTPAVFDH